MRLKLFAVSMALLWACSAHATILINETFTHPDGNLVGQVPTPGPGAAWAAHSGTTGPVQVSSGQAVIVQGNAEDVNSGTGTAMGAGDRWYAGFDFSNAGGSSSVYFAMFLQGTSLFDARIWVTAPTAGGDYRLAISNDNSITDGDGEVFSGDLVFGTTYRLVSYYDYDAMAARLWIDPANEASPSILAADPGFQDEVVAYAFRQASGNSTQTIDNLIVATTFNEAVPEPATLALLALGGLAVLRRR